MIVAHLPKTITARALSNLIRKTSPRTAGIIIIGNEILTGEVADTNSHYIVKSLYKLGVCTKRISVIGDEIGLIGDEVRKFSDQYTYVITTGGIGPTHDDVTFEAIAKAFDEPLVPHPILVDICSEYYSTRDLTCPGMKLAYIPKSAKLTFGDELKQETKMNYPNVSIKNVYIFPGIPQLLHKLLDKLGDKLFQSDQKFYKKVVYVNVTEKSIVVILNSMVKEFPDVIFGSYPELENTMYKVKVTMESTDPSHTNAAYEKILQMLPKEYVVNKP